MATIDEVLAAMPEAAAEAAYEYLTIDPVTRRIIVPEAEEIFGVESDTQAARKYFQCPRYVGDNVDLAACFLRVNYRNANGEVDAYLVQDAAVSGDLIVFSWELSRKVTQYKGQIQFVVCACYPHTGGSMATEWNTTVAVGTVLEGLEPDSSSVEAETSDVITQLRAETAAQTDAVEACGAAQVKAVEAAAAESTADAKAQIEAKGDAVKASIPADYTTLANTVDRLTHDRAAAIVGGAEGETVQVTDASADPLQGLRIFGRSTQASEPTPDNPVDIVSLAAPVVTVCGKNLVNLACHSGENNYIALVNAYDLRAIKKGQRYTLSVDLHATAATRAYWNNAAKLYGYLEFDVAAGTNRYIYSFTAWDDGALYEAGSNIVNKYPANDGVVVTATNAQLELGDVATDYEPYTSQILTTITPDGLPGIPVTSGGNYTDADGQQWIADEVDLARGVYVQRVGTVVLTGGESWSLNSQGTAAGVNAYHFIKPGDNMLHSRGYCTHFKNCGPWSDGLSSATNAFWIANDSVAVFKTDGVQSLIDFKNEIRAAYDSGNPVTLYYVCNAPTETPLTTEELQAFRALHSNKLTTTVLNDAGAWMAVEYAADPKLYIDRKIAELVAANNN